MAGDVQQEALDFITASNLKYPGEQLLRTFVENAKAPTEAAAFLLERAHNKYGLESVLSDWKNILGKMVDDAPAHSHLGDEDSTRIQSRDHNKCRLTGLGHSPIDPLIIVPILPWLSIVDDAEPMHNVLRAFLGDDIAKLTSDTNFLPPDVGHWLVRKSAFQAQRRGFFRIKRFPSQKPQQEYSVACNIIGDIPDLVKTVPVLRFDEYSSEEGLPDFERMEIASQFAQSVRWLLVCRGIDHKPKPAIAAFSFSLLSQLKRRFSETLLSLLVTLWRSVPGAARIFIYLRLASLGHRLYGSTCSHHVLRLPFGLYLKDADRPDHEGLANEFGSLKLVRQHTKVPVPRPIDLVSNSKSTYLLTSALPGQHLGAAIDMLSHQEASALVTDLQECLTELRCIPQSVMGPNPQYRLSNAIGGPLYDYRIILGMNADEIPDNLVGPFASEDDFNRMLQVAALPNHSHTSGHDIVFTHGDLNLRNIVVHNGRLSGFVDWENSGWFPDYWEYTKALFITKYHRRWLSMVEEVFGVLGDFEAERKTERRFWDYCF